MGNQEHDVEPGYLFGEKCGREECTGVIGLHDSELDGCSCHINPPCSYCTESREYCPECDWEAGDEVDISSESATIVPIDWYKEKPLDKTKIDWRVKGHSNSTMECNGVYPPGTTESQVRKEVDGTFGGRFVNFGGGTFKFIAYTD